MIALLGHSASGKSSVERELEKLGYKRIISYTTRPIRNGEKNHVDYHYISSEEFNEKIKQNFWAEKTIYRTWNYGIAWEDCLNDAIVVVEPNGFRKLKAIQELHITSFYIKSDENLRLARMAMRGDNPTEIFRRLFSDQGTFACIEEEVDYVIESNSQTVKEVTNEIVNILQGGAEFGKFIFKEHHGT